MLKRFEKLSSILVKLAASTNTSTSWRGQVQGGRPEAFHPAMLQQTKGFNIVYQEIREEIQEVENVICFVLSVCPSLSVLFFFLKQKLHIGTECPQVCHCGLALAASNCLSLISLSCLRLPLLCLLSKIISINTLLLCTLYF